MFVKGFCDGWERKPHHHHNAKMVINPLGKQFGACPDCIEDIAKDLRTGGIMGTFRVLAEDGTVERIMKPPL